MVKMPGRIVAEIEWSNSRKLWFVFPLGREKAIRCKTEELEQLLQSLIKEAMQKKKK